MPARRPARGIRTAFAVQAAVAVCCMVAARAAEEPPATGSRLAIVATAAADAGLVDLLTAELAKEPGLALVERQAIGNVLDELRVSQVAADADTTLKLGQLLAADALLLVEPEPTAEPPRTRLRIVETKTGIRLGDWPVPAAGLAAGDMADVLGGLRLALAKVGVPPGARQLVGMIGILPEAASGDLAALARSLTVLVEQDLQALPDVVILERQQLRRLTSEHDLTGIERGLKTSTRLVEGGLRREGDRLVLTLQFVPLTGGAGPKATVESTRQIPALRRAAAEALATLRGAEPDRLPAAEDPATESALLAARAKRLQGFREHTAALRLAEAAYGLAPSNERFQQAHWAYLEAQSLLSSGIAMLKYRSDWSRHWFSRDVYPTAEAARIARLELAIRAADLVRDHHDRSVGDPKYLADLQFDISRLLFYLRYPIEGDAERRLAAELTRVEDATYARMLADARAAGSPTATALILQRLEAGQRLLAGQGKGMAEGVAEFLSAARQELAREREAGRLPPDRDRFEARYHDLVWRAVNEYVHPAPPLAEIRPVLDALAESETAAFRIIGWSRLLELPDDAGASAAERLLDALFSGVVLRGPRQLDQESLFEKSAVAATRRLAKAGRLTAFVERMVAKAESERDLTGLVGWPHALLSLIRGDREHAAAFAARVDALIAAKAYAAAVQPAAEFYRQRAALLNAHENRPTRVAPPEGGPLDAYETVPVRTTGVDRDFGILAMIHVDRSAGGDQRRPLVLVCAKHHGFPRTPSPSDPPEFDYLIGRAGADGREMIVAARCRLPLRVILDMATGGGRVFFGSEQHGLAVVSADGTTMITTRDGLPSDHVGPMAWLDDRLYVAVPAGLAAVDPVTKRCLSIASARSLESRNPLDGTANYAITGLVADPPRGRLVVLVQADFNRVGRYAAGDPAASQTPEGLWSFTPADRTWARLEPGGVEQLVNGGDHLLYKRGDVLHRLDLASSAITPLAGHSRGGLAYASQRGAEHAFCDGLLFNARSGRARDASGTEHAWRPGTGCQGSSIWRVGGELLVFDEFGNRLFLIRKRTRAAADAPSP
ncbi:MAG: hypothetical protein LW698_06160 [Planctomycetaceae bacterium]|jgi:hypothetical protein|nr:hypothetical protein [Planctomycetaceae bacterium]